MIKDFFIKDIYNTHRDYAADLLYKSLRYKESFKRGILSSEKEIFPNEDVYYRYLIGTSLKRSEIIRRPLSKFQLDIAKQLEIIP